MPRFTYELLNKSGDPTGKLIEKHFPIGRHPTDECVVNGRRARRRADIDYASVAAQAADKPQEFWPASVGADRVAEARAAFPNRKYRDDGVLMVDGRSEIKQICREEGLINSRRRQPVKKKGRVIARSGS